MKYTKLFTKVILCVGMATAFAVSAAEITIATVNNGDMVRMQNYHQSLPKRILALLLNG